MNIADDGEGGGGGGGGGGGERITGGFSGFTLGRVRTAGKNRSSFKLRPVGQG